MLPTTNPTPQAPTGSGSSANRPPPTQKQPGVGSFFGANKEAQAIWHQIAGDLPSLKELTADARFRPDDNATVCIDSLSHSSPWEWVGWIEWITEFRDARNKVVNDAADPHDTFATMIANLNRTIAQYTA